MKPREYQSEVIDKASNHLQNNNRCCVSLATGAGKTVVFCLLAQRLPGKVLVLVNRIELLKQTIEAFDSTGVFATPVTAKSRNIKYSEYTVAMAQTIQSRFKRGKFHYDYYDYIIIDECHRLDYAPSLENFKGKIVGFTATPIIYKNLSFTDPNGREKTKKVPLSKYYHHLIQGVGINYLIKNDFLVPEEVITSSRQISDLVIDAKTGDYSNASLNNEYDNTKAYDELTELFETYAKGKKTIIFNPTTKVSLKVFQSLNEMGVHVRNYDSVNNDASERAEIVNWFKNTPGAVLCNVNVFTTGFDCKEVECIILNRKTASLSLFLQMVGRGGRITDAIYKPKFTLIDLGENVNDHGNWSDERDWEKYFNDASEKIKIKREPEPKMCQECGSFILPKATVCEFCGVEVKKKDNVKKGGISTNDLTIVKVVKPDVNKLLDYCKNNELTRNEARKIFYAHVASMFCGTPKDKYANAKISGLLDDRVKRAFTSDYFKLQGADLEGSRIYTLERFFVNIIKQIDKYYEL